MWKTLKPGEPVAIGDTIRYRKNNNGVVPNGEVYQVVKEDQHYFEICPQGGGDVSADDIHRKIIRYIDIGYNLSLERWSGPITGMSIQAIP
ncbi:hypothetical protein [Puia dinghuensis]|uniref:Uncharacterized protein n=1 Tax=Puia dinghuensis TaxID=1792502 RepID=A0A8J2XW05_9BACT|nr:hypothetical protein [Puia dinghuensis]GGB20524.1 hypothetical protein GCM10011511_50310 [Puia dinghuensis]